VSTRILGGRSIIFIITAITTIVINIYIPSSTLVVIPRPLLWICTSIRPSICVSFILPLWCWLPPFVSSLPSSWGDGETVATLWCEIKMIHSLIYDECINCLSWSYVKSAT
jgi:hypothetical protein